MSSLYEYSTEFAELLRQVEEDSINADTAAAAVGEGPDDAEGLTELPGSLPDTMEYWGDPDRASPSAFRYLTALRQSPLHRQHGCGQNVEVVDLLDLGPADPD